MPDPISGFQSPGPRFNVRIRSLAHENIYLPLRMRCLPQISRILEGASPLEVFNCADVSAARLAFYELRKRYDFPYWAALHFKVRDIADPHKIVPLRLNPFQHRLVDTLIRDTEGGHPHKYIISKTIPRVGLTTCVQAYILWLQTFHSGHSITCTTSDSDMEAMKTNVSRVIHKNGGRNRISLDHQGNSAFFQSFYTPHILDRIPARFVHLADMSKWLDHTSDTAPHIFQNAVAGWRQLGAALFIMEGDRPSDSSFCIKDHQNYRLPEAYRLMQLRDFTTNPLFLQKVITASDPDVTSDFRHIDLDSTPIDPRFS